MMRKMLLWLPVVTLLSLITVHTYFGSGFPYTHDGENHLARFANYKIAVKELQIPPRFAPNLMNRYGYPVFNYNYPLANIVSLPFSIIGTQYELTFKILIAFFLILGGMGSIALLNQFLPSLAKQGVLATLLCWYASQYLFNIILYRGNIGELIAYALLPWMFWSVYHIGSKQLTLTKHIWVIGIWFCFLLSHNISAPIGVLLSIGLASVLYKKNLDQWKKLFGVIIIATLLSLWFWAPALLESNLTIITASGNQSAYDTHFPTLSQLLFAQGQFGFSYPGSIDGLSFAIGLVQVTIFLVTGTIFLKKTKQVRKTKYFLPTIYSCIIFASIFVFQLSITKQIWNVLPALRFIQFPWRLSLFLSPIIPILTVVAFHHLSSKGRWVLIGFSFLQFVVLVSQKPVDYFHKSNIDYDVFSQSTTTQNENMPKSFTYTQISDWKPAPVLSDSDAQVVINKWSGSRKEYEVVSNSGVTVIEPTMFFSGWRTYIKTANDTYIAEYVDSAEIGGRIAYVVPPGKAEITTVFTQRTPARVIGNTVSALTGLFLIVYIVFTIKKQHVQA